MENSIRDFLSRNNLPIFDPVFNEGWQPVPEAREYSYVADEKPLQNGSVLKVFVIRSWKTSEKFVWKNMEGTSEDVRQAVSDLQKKQIENKKKLNEKTALEAQRLWEKALPMNGHLPEYLNRKGLTQTYGAKLDPECHDTIYIPMRDLGGKLWGIQQIFLAGVKMFLPGQKGTGLCHVIGDLTQSKKVFVCEGFATGASVYEATGLPVVVAFMAHNLVSLAPLLKQTYPTHEFTIAADNDAHLEKNAGILKGEEAAKILGSGFVYPQFKSYQGKSTTDWNDLHRLEGLQAVKEQLSKVHSENVKIENKAELQPIFTIDPKTNKPKLPSQQQLALAMIKHYGNDLVKQDRDIFWYDGSIWREIPQAGRDRFITEMQKLSGGYATHAYLKAAFELFVCEMSSVPDGVSLRDPHPFCINLKNGTVHLERSKDTYGIAFRPHRREDYLINLLPFEYEPGFGTRNTSFEDMLTRLFQGDPDASQKIEALQLMFGACLVSRFPHFFFLVGAPGTGKSTVIQLASNLVSQENWCSVEPHEFTGFNLETMAGKLLNFETDVSLDKPMSDSNLKKVLDGRPICIRRKHRQDIYARLPAVHIFGGNDIPKTLEGSYRSHDRRWTFIEFNNPQTIGTYDLEFHRHVFESSPQGIFNWAMLGLLKLLDRKGHYLTPESGKKRMQDWQQETDIVGQFLEDLDRYKVDGNYKLIRDEKGSSSRKDVFECFNLWEIETQGNRHLTSRNALFKTLRMKGFKEKVVQGVDVFEGFKVKLDPQGGEKSPPGGHKF